MSLITLPFLLVVQLANYINDRQSEIGLPCPVLIEDRETTGEQLSINAMAGGKILKQYVDGGYVGNFPFAVRYQLSQAQLGGQYAKLDVPLWTLGTYFESNLGKIAFEHAEVQKIEMTGLPHSLTRVQNGISINQAIFILQYYKNA